MKTIKEIVDFAVWAGLSTAYDLQLWAAIEDYAKAVAEDVRDEAEGIAIELREEMPHIISEGIGKIEIKTP